MKNWVLWIYLKEFGDRNTMPFSYPIRKKLKSFRDRPRYIILHSTNCPKINSNPLATADTPEYQWWKLVRTKIFPDKTKDVNIHYFIELVYHEPQITVGRPINYICDYGLDSKYNKAIHIMFCGDFDQYAGRPEIYQAIAYRVINPIVKMFRVPWKNILLHSEIDDKSESCPGKYFSKDMIKKFLDLKY